MRRSQGEIFGIALFFVVIIIGVIVYANFQAIEQSGETEEFEEKQFEILSADSINGLKKMSTNCEVEQNRDALEDVIRYCFDNARSDEDDPIIECEQESGGTVEKSACSYSYEILNTSLHNLFNEDSDEALVAPIPFSLELTNPSFEHEQWHNRTITNLGDFGLSLNRSKGNFYLDEEYRRNNAGFDVITTGRREVELTFDIYHR